MHDACAHLEDAWPERAALRLDLAGSEHGLTPTGLGDRTLAVGTHAGESVSDLLGQALATEAPDEDLRRAVSAASHGFDGCVDHGALVALEELRVCGEERRVTGPEGAACHTLDDECGRGYFDEAQACCALRPRALGVGCAEGSGRCDGNGACIPLDAEDGMAVELPEGVDAAIGLPSWVDHTSAEAPSVWLTEDGMQLGLGGQTVVDLSRVDSARIPYAAVHLLGDGADRSAAGVIVDVPGVLRSLHLEPRADLVVRHDANDDANDDAGAAEPTEAAPAPSDEPLRVVAVLQSSGDLSSALGEVGAAGRVELGCPGEASGIRCELSEGGVTVSGRDLAFASVVHGGRQHIVPTAFYGVCLFPPCSPPPPVCRYGQAQGCTASCGKTGMRYCTWNGSWGTCRAFSWNTSPEVCNGIDDDCDGQIDENGATICDDGLTCNVDSCNTQGWHYLPALPHGYWAPPSGTCEHVVAPSCADSHTCATPICSATVPTTSVAGHTIGTINVLNHCYEELDDNYCTNTWDACDCNGPEQCAPTGNTDPSGCVMTAGTPCEAGDAAKPDNDGLHGSHIDQYNTIHHPGGECTIEACIEPDAAPGAPTCNFAHLGLTTPALVTQAQDGWARAMRFSSRHHTSTPPYTRPDGTSVTVECPSINIWDHKTYLEPGCDDDNSCTDDRCNPMLGPLVPRGCVHTPILGVSPPCDPRMTRDHDANLGGPLPCSANNMHCDMGACVPEPAYDPTHPYASAFNSHDANGTCATPIVPGPGGVTMQRRANLSGINGHYGYGTPGSNRAPRPSCHLPVCGPAGNCDVATDNTQCTTSHGCIVDRCTTRTDVQDANGVIGCQEAPNGLLCQPLPSGNECLTRLPNSCQPDGICINTPNAGLCNSSNDPLPAGNQCLTRFCSTGGQCGHRPDPLRCPAPPPCPPGLTRPYAPATCSLVTGRCGYAACVSGPI